jgi:hypothetical protein
MIGNWFLICDDIPGILYMWLLLEYDNLDTYPGAWGNNYTRFYVYKRCELKGKPTLLKKAE